MAFSAQPLNGGLLGGRTLAGTPFSMRGFDGTHARGTTVHLEKGFDGDWSTIGDRLTEALGSIRGDAGNTRVTITSAVGRTDPGSPNCRSR